MYYEGDCFSGLRNPYIPPGSNKDIFLEKPQLKTNTYNISSIFLYIPPDVENPSLAQMNQKMLVGEVWVGSGGDDDDRFVLQNNEKDDYMSA